MSVPFVTELSESIIFVDLSKQAVKLCYTLFIAPDDTIYKMWDGESSLDGVANRYAKYATGYNTFSFSKMIANKNYVTVPAGTSNITLR